MFYFVHCIQVIWYQAKAFWTIKSPLYINELSSTSNYPLSSLISFPSLRACITRTKRRGFFSLLRKSSESKVFFKARSCAGPEPTPKIFIFLTNTNFGGKSYGFLIKMHRKRATGKYQRASRGWRAVPKAYVIFIWTIDVFIQPAGFLH